MTTDPGVSDIGAITTHPGVSGARAHDNRPGCIEMDLPTKKPFCQGLVNLFTNEFLLFFFHWYQVPTQRLSIRYHQGTL